MTEAQIMEKLRRYPYKKKSMAWTDFFFVGSVVTKGDPNELYKRLKRVGQG